MKFLFGVLFLIFLTKAGFAWQTAGLELTILDQNSEIIPNVTAKLEKNNKLIKEIFVEKTSTLTFSNIEPGKYLLEIKADGFEIFSEEIEIKFGNNQKTVRLQIARISENVSVDGTGQDKSLDSKNGAFTNFLTKAEIEALPDDPEQLKKVLKQKFGEDSEFFVDGFGSAGLPSKSQIASIKVSQSSFDAEYHTPGVAYVEITTKAGATKWLGSVSFDFNDESINARHPFALQRYPEQNKTFELFLAGPIKKDKTSFFINVSSDNSYETNDLVASLASGQIAGFLRSPTNNFAVNGKISQNLSQYQTFNLSYDFNRNDLRNLGTGGFNLPERAFNSNAVSHQLRFSEAGNVGKRFFNEFRFQYLNESEKNVSINDEPAIIVLDAFSGGGAGNDSLNRKQSFYFADNFLFGIKNHALKIGGSFNYERRKLLTSENRNGTFTFSDLNDFDLGKPAVFTQQTGDEKINFAQIQFSGFVQDDIRLHKSFLLNLGLRYERQNNLRDGNNFAPRLGFSWSPNESGKTTFRGGIGILYNWLQAENLAVVLSQDASQTAETIIINPGFPDPFLSGTSQIVPNSYWKKASDLKNPYVFLAQIGVQRQLSAKASLRVQYAYQKGVHQFRVRDANAPVNFVRPDPSLGRITQFESSAFFVRNSLTANFKAAPTKRTFFSLDYRLSKSISDTDGYFSLPSDNYNLRLDRSFSNNDQRHRASAAFGWTLSKGFRFSTLFHINSPLPYTITTGRDDNDDTIFNDRPGGILRNSERGSWQKQFDTSLSWQFSLEKKQGNVSLSADPDTEISKGKTIKLEINADNVFNQTNFTSFSGVLTSPFFRQPVAADNPRRIQCGLRFNF